MKKLTAVLIAGISVLSILSATAQTQPNDPERFYRGPSRFSFVFPSAGEGGDIALQADRQEGVPGEYVILEGNVRIEYQDLVMSADHITVNLRTNDVTAEGNVVIDQGPGRLTASRVIFNLDSKTGTLFEAKGAFEPSVYFMADKLEKLDEDTFALTDGVFTSCDLNDPSWSFRVGSGIVTLEDYARLRSLAFRARKAPVFWLPYIVWPTKRERSQGFLIPKVGFSSRFGSYVGNSYFIPVGDSYDATLYADFHSDGYYGAGTTARYAPSESTRGQVMGYAVRVPETDSIEWKYEIEHTQDGLPGGFRGVIDIQDFSDLEFFREFERDFRLNTLSNIYSSAYVTKNAGSYSLNIRADRRKHFLGPGNSQVFEQVPAVEFRTYPNRIGNTPLYFSMESSASHLRTSLGADYYRADIFPTLSFKLPTPPWLSVKPQIAVRETYYTSSLDPTTRQISDESLSRFYGQAQVEMVGPSFSRIYSRSIGPFERFKHVIEPRVRYAYTSDVEEQNRVIRFDTVDTPLLPIVRDSVEYALVNRVIAKEAGEGTSPREIISLELRQTASLSEPFQTFSPGGLAETRFTPLAITARYNPFQTVSIDASASIDNQTNQFDRASLAANLVNQKNQSYVNLTWFSSFRRPGATGGDLSQFRIATGGPVWRNRIRADVWLNVDATEGDILEQRYITAWFASCYNVSFEYRDFLVRRIGEPTRNRDYLISLNLKNVGTFVDLRGSIDSLF